MTNINISLFNLDEKKRHRDCSEGAWVDVMLWLIQPWHLFGDFDRLVHGSVLDFLVATAATAREGKNRWTP